MFAHLHGMAGSVQVSRAVSSGSISFKISEALQWVEAAAASASAGEGGASSGSDSLSEVRMALFAVLALLMVAITLLNLVKCLRNCCPQGVENENEGYSLGWLKKDDDEGYDSDAEEKASFAINRTQYDEEMRPLSQAPTEIDLV